MRNKLEKENLIEWFDNNRIAYLRGCIYIIDKTK